MHPDRAVESNHMDQNIDKISGAVVDSAMRVHTALGPGLLESSYQACLEYELRDRGFSVEKQVAIPVVYRDVRLDVGYRADMIVDRAVLVELKCISRVLPIHQAQLLSYLKLSNLQVGLLLNFHVRHFRDGISRMATQR